MFRFRGAGGGRLLQRRGVLVVRRLAALLGAGPTLRLLSQLLEDEEDLPFASAMVQALNLILLTVPEVAPQHSPHTLHGNHDLAALGVQHLEPPGLSAFPAPLLQSPIPPCSAGRPFSFDAFEEKTEDGLEFLSSPVTSWVKKLLISCALLEKLSSVTNQHVSVMPSIKARAPDVSTSHSEI